MIGVRVLMKAALEGKQLLSHCVLLGVSALCTLVFLAWVLWFCRFGVDFRDEGLYLVWMADPFKYDVSVTQFGFLYHPLFELLGRDIVAVRRVNLLITFGLAWAFANVVLVGYVNGFAERVITRHVVAAALACTSLSYLHTWLPTPSYNWLALQAMLVAAWGLVLVARKPVQSGWGGSLLIGIAGWMLFMAKPTSAALLGLTAFAYLAATRRLRWGPLLLCVGTAVLLLWLSALWIDGAVEGFIRRYRIGLDLAALMGGGHKLLNFLRFGDLRLDPYTRVILPVGVGALLVLFGLANSSSSRLKWGALVGGLLLAVFMLGVVAGYAKNLLPIGYTSIENRKGLLPLVIPLAALLVFLLRGLRWWRPNNRSRWALLALMLTLPYVYVFGTANDYWWQVSQATFFWLLVGVLLMTRAPDADQTPEASPADVCLLPIGVLVLASQAAMVVIVQAGIEVPYGQLASLRDQHKKVRIGETDSYLRLSPGVGAYVEQAIQVSRSAGFTPGTPVLDLTGRSPSTLYAMAASNTSQAWMIGGYPGSDALTRAYMARTSCDELARAWLLIQPDGTTKISTDVLGAFGAELDRDYENVGSIVMEERFWGYREVWTQYLLKPRRSPSDAVRACLAVRGGQS